MLEGGKTKKEKKEKVVVWGFRRFSREQEKEERRGWTHSRFEASSSSRPATKGCDNGDLAPKN